MKSTLCRRKSLSVESLERREMMAGDVQVYARGSDLYIMGDAAANHVQVAKTASGALNIYGQVLAGDATRINGSMNTVTVSGTPRNVYVGLGAGNDQIDFGTGNGRVINLTGDLWIDAGAGSDWTMVRQTSVGRDLIVNTGTGALDRTFVFDSSVADDLLMGDPTNQVISAADRNEVSLVSCTVRDRVDLLFSNGQDSVDVMSVIADTLYARLGAGNDSFSMNYTRPRYFTADGGTGWDTFFAPRYNNTRFWGTGFERVTNG